MLPGQLLGFRCQTFIVNYSQGPQAGPVVILQAEASVSELGIFPGESFQFLALPFISSKF